MPGAHKSHSIAPLPQQDRGRKNATEGSWVEMRAGRDHSPIPVTGKTDSTQGNQFNTLPIKIRVE